MLPSSLTSALCSVSLLIRVLTLGWRTAGRRPWSVCEHCRSQNSAAAQLGQKECMLQDFICCASACWIRKSCGSVVIVLILIPCSYACVISKLILYFKSSCDCWKSNAAEEHHKMTAIKKFWWNLSSPVPWNNCQAQSPMQPLLGTVTNTSSSPATNVLFYKHNLEIKVVIAWTLLLNK